MNGYRRAVKQGENVKASSANVYNDKHASIQWRFSVVNDARNERSLTIILKRMRRSHRVRCAMPTYREALSLPVTRAFNYGTRKVGYSDWVVALTTVVNTTRTDIHHPYRIRTFLSMKNFNAFSLLMVVSSRTNCNS